MSGGKVRGLFVYTTSTVAVAILTAIGSLLCEIPLSTSILIVLFHLSGCATAYYLGRQYDETSDVNQIPEACSGTAKQKRTDTLNIVVQVMNRNRRITTLEQSLTQSELELEGQDQTTKKKDQESICKESITELKQRTTELGADHASLKNQVVYWDNVRQDEKDEASQVNWGPESTTLSLLLDSNKQNSILLEKNLGLTKAGIREKLTALKAEKELLESTEDEESWQQAELLRLWREANDAYYNRESGSNARELDDARKTADKKYTMYSAQCTRKYQRMRRIGLDIKALYKKNGGEDLIG